MTGALRTYAFGAGSVVVGADGSGVAVGHPTRGHSMLLEEDGTPVERLMHDADHRWGKGFVITDAGSRRWDAPSSVTWHADGVDLDYALGPMRLDVTRRIGASWTETYRLTNVGPEPLRVGSLAVSTPWRDLYSSSRDSLRRSVHAHVWPGGADAYVWAVPMDGSGPGLGLVVTEGELWSYSVESRNQVTMSNVRGHLYLHVTDAARNPTALGGQPEIVLASGEAYAWSWRLDWYDTLAALQQARRPLVTADRLAAEVGETLPLVLVGGAVADTPNPVVGLGSGVHDVRVTAADGRRSRVALLFHPELRTVVERRIRFVLDHQRPTERGGSRGAAFVPYDNGSGLTVLEGSWGDWSDSRERVGTALLLQEARAQGWGDRAKIDEALAAYAEFVHDHVVADGVVRGDNDEDSGPRLYNFPWFARFLLDQDDLDSAFLIMERYYELGGDHFLAFDLGAVITDLASGLRERGRSTDADRLERRLVAHARSMISYGDDLPAHEVNYEQSMVAPLLDLLQAARRIDPGAVPVDELVRRLAWLEAFAGDQPDVRLRHVPIRHWDGYWFGGLRLWGDVFPHYWSCLSAAAYLAWTDDLDGPERATELHAKGRTILRANLASFFDDGSATCAFVYPSCVDGRPANVADPLANDQDWALVYALRHGLGG